MKVPPGFANELAAIGPETHRGVPRLRA
jgi:hypothetical protein